MHDGYLYIVGADEYDVWIYSAFLIRPENPDICRYMESENTVMILKCIIINYIVPLFIQGNFYIVDVV